MRKSDKNDLLTIFITLCVGLGVAWIAGVLLSSCVRAETILNFTACREKKCIHGEVVGPDGQMHQCIMFGQHIILQHLKAKSLHGYFPKAWSCKVGKPSIEA